MAKKAREVPSYEEKRAELEAEAHSHASDAAPFSVGRELVEDSAERKAKLKEAQGERA
jgi:hypothetical protein